MTSVGSILGGAFGLVRRQPLSVLVWGVIYMVALLAVLVAMRPFFQVYAELISQQLAAGPGKPLDPQALQPYIGRIQAAGGIVFLVEIAMFALLMTLFTATQRAVLRPAERGFCHLRLGGDELRMMGLAFFLMIGINIAMFVAMLVIGIVVAVVAVASGGAPVAIIPIAVAGMVVVMGAMIYAEVRLSLAFPLTFLRRNIVVAEAWRLGKGHFWTMFGAYFVIGLVYMVLAGILFGVAFGPFVSALMQGPGTAEAVQLAFQQEAAQLTSINPLSVGLALGGALLGGLSMALFGGAMATAARDLLAGDPAMTATARDA